MAKYIIVVVIISTIFFGCKKYLEVNPDTRIEPTDVDDYKAIITGAYPEAYHLFTEIMTDNYQYFDYADFNSATIVSWFKPIYLWSDNYALNLPVGPEKAWDSYYHDIYKANVVLEGIDKVSDKPEFIKSVKGEALLIRAYNHFMLVNLFAKHYNKNSAREDLGIPYSRETQKEGIKHYSRDNVEKVYQLVEEDAKKGLQLLDIQFIDVPKFHFSKEAAYAFLSRIYLFKEEWDNCIAYADSALNINNSIRDLPADYDEFIVAGDYRGFAEDYCISAKDNILLMNKTLEWNSYSASGFYSNEFSGFFETDDLRGKLFVFNNNSSPNWHMLKFFSNRKDGQQYSNVTLFNVEEVFLNRAEAYIRKPNPEMNKAIEDLNAIRKYRFVNYRAYNLRDFSGGEKTDTENLLDAVLNERRFELCYEGYRWFDLKRLKIEIKHKTESGYKTLKSNDLRYVLQIPEKELSSNNLMEPNPR